MANVPEILVVQPMDCSVLSPEFPSFLEWQIPTTFYSSFFWLPFKSTFENRPYKTKYSLITPKRSLKCTKMLSSFVGWIMFSSSSSSSSSSQCEEEEGNDHTPNDYISTDEPHDHILINDTEKNEVVDVSADDDRIPVGVAVTDASASVTIALPATAAPIGDHPPITTTTTVIGNKKRRRNDEDDTRKLFHRLWTKEDEMELLQGFLDYKTRRGNTHSNDTALFYDQIRSKLQVVFNKNQLFEKLRRLKKKYQNFLHKINSDKEFSFRSGHDQATFEISRKIWGDDHEPSPNLDNLNLVNVKVESEEDFVGDSRPPKLIKSRHNDNIDDANVSDSIEETMRSCLSPLFKELLSNAFSQMPVPLSSGGVPAAMNLPSGEAVDEKWREQRILELEVYSKRLELIQDQIKAALEELRSMRG